MKIVCAWCKKVVQEGEEVPGELSVSHGICVECRKQMEGMAEPRKQENPIKSGRGGTLPSEFATCEDMGAYDIVTGSLLTVYPGRRPPRQRRKRMNPVTRPIAPRVIEIIGSTGTDVTLDQLAAHMGESPRLVRLAVRRLIRKGILERKGGWYRLK